MKHGFVRHSITLPDDPIGTLYSPDGLTEADIDALLAEAGVEVDEPPMSEPAPVLAMRTDDTRSAQTNPSSSEAA